MDISWGMEVWCMLAGVVLVMWVLFGSEEDPFKW